ncbi:hypothetical protein ACMFMF_008786 [Clarireedia jacksonii]
MDILSFLVNGAVFGLGALTLRYLQPTYDPMIFLLFCCFFLLSYCFFPLFCCFFLPYLVCFLYEIVCYISQLQFFQHKRTCAAKHTEFIRDLDYAEAILKFTVLSSRSRPNQRLVMAFDIDNAFTTFDLQFHREFVARAKGLLHKPEPSMSLIVENTTQFLSDKSSQIQVGAAVSLLPLVQELCFRFVMDTLLASSSINQPSISSVSRITELINSLWVASKLCNSSGHPEKVFSMKEEVRRELDLVFSDSTERNPLSILLPAYETLWRVVLRCFLEVSFRNQPHITREWRNRFYDFLRDPTLQQFDKRGRGSSVGHIVKESLRLYPPTRRIYRQEHDDGPILAIDVEYLQRMEEIWGVDGKSFKPERWCGLGAEEKGRYKRAWMPFGKDRFSCPAQKWAPMMIGILVGALIESFGSDSWVWDRRAWSDVNMGPLENGREALEGLKIRKISVVV